MRDEKMIRYEKPELAKYGLFGVKGVVFGESDQGDIEEICDSEFDE